jgi:hypothetical protein
VIRRHNRRMRSIWTLRFFQLLMLGAVAGGWAGYFWGHGQSYVHPDVAAVLTIFGGTGAAITQMEVWREAERA